MGGVGLPGGERYDDGGVGRVRWILIWTPLSRGPGREPPRGNKAFDRAVTAIRVRCLRYLWLMVVVAQLHASCNALASPCGAFTVADVVGLVRLDAAWHPTRLSTESQGVFVKTYKGPLTAGMPIRFHGSGVCYDAPDKTGAVYVVFARRLEDGRYSTDCTRTHLLGEFPPDLAFLERFSARPWMAVLIEPFGCNEHRLPGWLRQLWIRALLHFGQ